MAASLGAVWPLRHGFSLFGSLIQIWSEQLSEGSVMDGMCAASESSSPRSYSWVSLTLLVVLVPPPDSLNLPWVIGALGD